MESMVSLGIIAVMAIGGALISVSNKNILHAIFGLGLSLVGIAGLFLYLGSPFVAVMEILIYVGGITITMIFAVMLTSMTLSREKRSISRWLFAAVPALIFFAVMAYFIYGQFGVAGSNEVIPVSTSAWSIERIGELLLTRFNLVFETLSVVLLLAIVGAIVIARKERQQ
jgi:NADH:ubiquinone oxidoreductase subunit 6 (subunit J)